MILQKMDVTSLCHIKNTVVIYTVKSPFNWIFVGIVVFSEEICFKTSSKKLMAIIAFISYYKKYIFWDLNWTLTFQEIVFVSRIVYLYFWWTKCREWWSWGLGKVPSLLFYLIFFPQYQYLSPEAIVAIILLLWKPSPLCRRKATQDKMYSRYTQVL